MISTTTTHTHTHNILSRAFSLHQPLGAVYEGAVRPAVTIPTAARVFYTEEFEFYPQLRPRLRSTFCGLDGTKKR